MAKKMKQLMMQGHPIGLGEEWVDAAITYEALEDLEIVGFQGIIENTASIVTQALMAELSTNSKHVTDLAASVGTDIQVSQMCGVIGLIFKYVKLVTSGMVAPTEMTSYVFPKDARPKVRQGDELNVHWYSSIADAGGYFCFLITVLEG